MVESEPARDGLRERKRRETLRRIIDAGIRLFIERGYEGTTLDDIAAAAGISRRTFFHYLKSKDDILLSLQGEMGEQIVQALLDIPAGKRPLDLVRAAILQICAPIPADEMIGIERLMRSSEAVQARKQASYVQHEAMLLAALRRRWPEPKREIGLRLVAMTALGATRIAIDALTREGGARSLAVLLNEAFDALEAEV